MSQNNSTQSSKLSEISGLPKPANGHSVDTPLSSASPQPSARIDDIRDWRRIFPRELRDLSFVPRWSIARLIKQQSVAEHHFFVAVYAFKVADLIEWTGDYSDLLRYALTHDWEESYTGDMPGPAKKHMIDDSRYREYIRTENHRRFGVLPDPSPEVKSITKAADMLDECMLLMSEQQLGNKSLGHIVPTSMSRLFDAIEKLPCSMDVQRKVRHIIEKAINAEQAEHSSEFLA